MKYDVWTSTHWITSCVASDEKYIYFSIFYVLLTKDAYVNSCSKAFKHQNCIFEICDIYFASIIWLFIVKKVNVRNSIIFKENYQTFMQLFWITHKFYSKKQSKHKINSVSIKLNLLLLLEQNANPYETKIWKFSKIIILNNKKVIPLAIGGF